MPHATDQERHSEPSVPILSWDYFYLGAGSGEEAEGRGECPLLVMTDSRSRAVFAHVLPSKGVDFDGVELVINLIVGDLVFLGLPQLWSRAAAWRRRDLAGMRWP